MSANTGGSRGVASFWKQPPLDVHSDVVIEQLIKETAQVPTVTTAAMEIKICNLCAPNNGKDSSAVFNELKSLLPPCCVIVEDFNLAMGKNRGLWQHPPATSNYDNSGWANCQAMARHLLLQDVWGHQHGHDANPICTHKTL